MTEMNTQNVPSGRWQALVEAVEKLAAAETLDDVIAIVRSKAREISGAEGVTFVLRDGGFCHYVDEDAVGPLWKGKRFPLTACISGWCMLNDRAAAIPDIYVDERIPHDAYRPTFVNSLVMVPVKAGTPIAAIGSYWSAKRAFGADELALVEALARSTSVAIQALRMRESLRDSEARLRVALAAGDLGAWEISLADDALVTSSLCRAAFGRGDNEPLDFPALLASVDAAERERVMRAFDHARAARGDLAFECGIHWPDGSAHQIEMRGRAVLDANGRPRALAGVVRDVTEQRLAQERLHRLQSDLAHAGRLTELGEMVSAIGHELRQPLTAANNYLAAARTMIGRLDEANAIKSVDKADAQFRRAQEILDRIRNFARKDESGSSAQDVDSLIAEARELAMIDPRHRGVDVRIETDAGLPKVLVDKVPTQQVLLNLLRNAFEATSGKGHVQVHAGRGSSPSLIEISVRDDGPGIAPQVMDRLFQPFVTTKPNGMGIGLSICHSIIEAQGGRMWVESKPGDGARFVMTLPAA